MPPTHIFVTAPEGRLVPIHPDDASAGAGMFYLEHKDAEGRPQVARVKYSADVRRAITDGDLIPSTIAGVAVKDLDKAAAAAPLASGGPLVTVDDRKAIAPADVKHETKGGSQ